MTRCAVFNCCIIMLRWRLRAPNAGLSSAPAIAVEAISCLRRARSAVFAARRPPTAGSTRSTGAASAAAFTGCESAPSSALRTRAAPRLARGARGRRPSPAAVADSPVSVSSAKADFRPLRTGCSVASTVPWSASSDPANPRAARRRSRRSRRMSETFAGRAGSGSTVSESCGTPAILASGTFVLSVCSAF